MQMNSSEFFLKCTYHAYFGFNAEIKPIALFNYNLLWQFFTKRLPVRVPRKCLLEIAEIT